MNNEELVDINLLVDKYLSGYKIEHFLSSGSFGAVYLLSKDDKKYAMKLFREDYVLNEYRLHGTDNRIKREIDIIKSISHKYLISYVDDFIYEYQGAQHYCLIMEYFEGITLRKLINDNGILSEEQALDIFTKILEGIAALHNFKTSKTDEEDFGVIHRDIKPENIMIDKAGNIKVLDFGISKIIDYSSITSTGDIMGTYAYMSPEQFKDSKHLKKTSDLYSLGVILYELLTANLPYKTKSMPALINEIINEHPIEPRIRNPKISNNTENIILKLLEKDPYKRFQNIESLLDSIRKNKIVLNTKEYDLTPRFILWLYQEKTMLERLSREQHIKPQVIFPAHLQSFRSGVLKFLNDNGYKKFIDPSTPRLAYETFRNTKGLLALPYAPKELEVISPETLNTYQKRADYAKLVLDEQIKLNADILLSPFHYVHNSSIIPTVTRNLIAEWLDLDIKLLRESIDYKKNNKDLNNKELYAGICLHAESLSSKAQQEYILNTFSAFDCDGYIVYADCINNSTSTKVLYHYIKTLQMLQENTGKPVIAGRVNCIGLGLLCAGITGYSSGAAQFDSFYEGLYSDESDAYNLYERYYFPQLLNVIGIKKKEPSRLHDINQIIGSCSCPYCAGKEIKDIINSESNKLHFAYIIHNEIEDIKNLSVTERIPYFINRIEIALNNYKKLQSIFLPRDYDYLKRWKVVFEKLNEDKKNK